MWMLQRGDSGDGCVWRRLCVSVGVLEVWRSVGCCAFCLYCDAWNCRCSCMGSVSVSSCRCIFVSRMHPVVVLNAAFCMTCSLLMLVEEARGDHTEEAYSRAGLITAL